MRSGVLVGNPVFIHPRIAAGMSLYIYIRRSYWSDRRKEEEMETNIWTSTLKLTKESMKFYPISVAVMKTLSSQTTTKNVNHTETTSASCAERPSPTSLWTPVASTTEGNLFQKTCNVISPHLNAQDLL